jgi:RNA polymerase sigma-70 factor (ECF subfamily)
MNKQTDQEIIRQILDGDIDAYAILVNRYSGPLLNLCYRYLQRREEAEDAIQEIFIKAYTGLENWEPRAQFKTWLYRIAINHCLNTVRRQKIVHFRSLQQMDQGFYSPQVDRFSQPAGKEEELLREQREKLIHCLLNQLSETHRTVLILYFYQEMSYKEIAETLQVSLSSVESRLFRAKKKLAKILSRQKNYLSKFFNY